MSKAWWSKGYFSDYWKKSSTHSSSTTTHHYPWGSSGSSGYGGYSSSYDEYDDWRDAYRSRYRSSLGYTSGRLTEATRFSFSSSITEGRGLLERAFREARDLVVILDFPFKISLQISNDGEEVAYGFETKGSRRLFIPTNVLDNTEYSVDERVTICCGQAIHEASHLKFTEYRVLSSFLSKLVVEKKFDLDGSDEKVKNTHISFLKSLINIIEDERVEDLLLTERPGYNDFIEKAKAYSYKNFIKRTKSDSGKIEAFLNNLFRLIRYPEGIDESIIEEYHEGFEKIQAHLSPLPNSTKESCKVGYKIYKEILSIFKDLKLSDKEISESLSSTGTIAMELYNVCLYGSDVDSSSTGDFMVDDSRVASIVNTKERGSSGERRMLAKLIVGTAECGTKDKVYFEKAKGNKSTYLRVAEEVSPYVGAIKRLIKNTDKNYTFNIHGCRSGLLDESKLAEAYQGVPQVYMRQGKVTTNGSTVCILIDESGSMSWNDKDKTARKAAILLNEAFKDLKGVDLYIYGHTADVVFTGSTEIRVYREGKKACDPYGLSASCARTENRDGTAIYEVGKRIRKFTNNHVIMFVISDGEPAAYNYYGASAIHDVKQNVSKLENDNFTVIQISIDTVRNVSEMFTNYIDLTQDLSKFPKTLGKIIKKAVVGDKKTIVT